MEQVSDEQFDAMISKALDAIPKLYQEKLNNVAIVIADEPTPDERTKLKLHHGQTLYGLYQGIPLTRRGAGYTMVLPDKITLYKLPLVASSRDMNELQRNITHTLWHEIAHYYGLGHQEIHAIEQRMELA